MSRKLGKCYRCELFNVMVNSLELKTDAKQSTIPLCDSCLANCRIMWAKFMSPEPKTAETKSAEPKQTFLIEEGELELKDDCTMYFGAHKDKKMKEVPAHYLLWIGDQSWITTHPRVQRYIERNRNALEEEVAGDE